MTALWRLGSNWSSPLWWCSPWRRTTLRLVFLYFMELTRDAMPWRLFAEIWMLVVTSVILGIYLLTPQ